MKTLVDRKAYLKDKGICYRCCASSSHLARNCNVAVKCTECNSENHCSAQVFKHLSPLQGMAGRKKPHSHLHL